MRKKILVVDDSRTVRMLGRIVLGPGYELIEAADGEEAVRKAEEERPDCVLLDVTMPKLDGFETCRRLRQLEATKEVPIVMVTSRTSPAEMAQGRAAGCTDYVTKPFDPVRLMEKIEGLLGPG
jgi:CheY-like chemotaxis protein